MSWRVFLTDRQASPSRLEVRSLGRNALGGPDWAKLYVLDDKIELTELQSWLGSGVEVYDPADRLAWWGYVDEVSQPVGKTILKTALSQMANRVAVRYNRMEPGSDFGAPSMTAWKDDLISQAIYGVKELILKRGMLSDSQALHLRDSSLRRLAMLAAGLVPGEDERARVICRGWMERLSWRQCPARSDVVGHSPAQLGSQTVGASLKQKSVAQSFTLSQAAILASISVKARKIGEPSDQLRLQIQTDSLGVPSGVVKAEAVLPASALSGESFAWVEAWFNEPRAFSADEKLWLVVARDGAVSSLAHFSLGLDENLGYPAGKLLVLDSSLSQWKMRVPDADLLFRMTALSDSAEMLAEIASTSGGFAAFSYEAEESLILPYVRDIGRNGLQAFSELLQLGVPSLGSLLAQVTPQRVLRVYPKPKAAASPFWLGVDGTLRDETGKTLEAVWQAVGSWLRSEAGPSCFLDNLNLNSRTNQYQLQTSAGSQEVS